MNSPVLDTCPQESDDGAELSVAREAGSPACCVYFLVSAAQSGPLHGLIKVGIADRFPIRHRQHTATWGPFDLSRSALIRVRSRQEALDLEKELRNHFGDPVAESIAKAAGRTLTSEDFIALKCWRRYPGRRDPGFTEFFAFACLVLMLSHVENWQKGSSARMAGTRLQRGIDLSQCTTRVQVANLSLTRAQRRELHERRRVVVCQVAEKMRASSRGLMSRAFAFAMAYREFMVAVDLRPWRAARAACDPVLGWDGLARIYFQPAGFIPYQNYAHLEPWLKTQADLRQNFAANAALADSLDLARSGRRRGRGGCNERIYTTLPEANCGIRHLPFPIRTEVECACVGNIYSDPFDPVFELYEMLEKAVGSDQVWRQPDFRW